MTLNSRRSAPPLLSRDATSLASGAKILFEETTREADLPTEQPEAQKKARVSSSDADPRRPCRAEGPSRPRPRPDFGLIHRVRRRATFAELSRVRPRRHGAVWVRRVRCPVDGPPQVAFAIGSHVGNAVIRNRIRRRLRASLQGISSGLVPGAAYLVGATPGAAVATQSELAASLAVCFGDLR